MSLALSCPTNRPKMWEGSLCVTKPNICIHNKLFSVDFMGSLLAFVFSSLTYRRTELLLSVVTKTKQSASRRIQKARTDREICSNAVVCRLLTHCYEKALDKQMESEPMNPG